MLFCKWKYALAVYGYLPNLTVIVSMHVRTIALHLLGMI